MSGKYEYVFPFREEGRKKQKKEGPRSKWTWNISWAWLSEEENLTILHLSPFASSFDSFFDKTFIPLIVNSFLVRSFQQDSDRIFESSSPFLRYCYSWQELSAETVLNKTSSLSFMTPREYFLSALSIGMIDRLFHEMIINWKWQSEGKGRERNKKKMDSFILLTFQSAAQDERQDRVMKLLTSNAVHFVFKKPTERSRLQNNTSTKIK